MTDELKISVGPRSFSEKNTDEKLDLIYQAVTTCQSTCADNVKGFRIACERYDHFIAKQNTIARLNKKSKGISLGIGVGTGVAGGLSASSAIDFIKILFIGG